MSSVERSNEVSCDKQKIKMMVSVIIPVYNRENTVCAAVDSVLAQTYGNLEIIVVDDGSSDRSLSVLGTYGDRIRVVCQSNSGPSAARNRGVAESTGEIVAFLDSDDCWLPEKIARQVALMDRAGQEMICCVCNALVKGGEESFLGETFAHAGIHPGFTEGVWLNPQAILSTRFLLFNQVVAIRREAFDRVGGFNERMRLLEDYELALRLTALGYWGVIREPLVLKYNDTNGIGVECMNDRQRHAEVRAEVISGILESADFLATEARERLQQTLDDQRIAMMACAALKRGEQ
jgi:glycosyltransferase involved in cell wall biosynthesis